MPRCTVCTHQDRSQIERALIKGDTSQRAIARQYDVSHGAINRHVHAGHVAKLLTKADIPALAAVVVEEDAVRVQANGVMEDLAQMKREAFDVLKEARGWALQTGVDGRVIGPGQKDIWTVRLQAVNSLNKTVETIGKVTGELAEKHLHVHTSPEWLLLREVIVKALAPYPEAKAAVVAAIQASNGSFNEGV